MSESIKSIEDEIEELRDVILEKLTDTNSIDKEGWGYSYYADLVDENMVLNTYIQLVHLIGDGVCRIICNGSSTGIRYLDVENAYNYHIQSGTYSQFEIKKISPTTCAMIAEITIADLNKDVLDLIFKYARLNEEIGNSIKKMKKYREINQADKFEVELGKHLSKEIRLRKINSVLC